MKLSDKLEIKIFILYLMKKIGSPMTFEEINDVVVCDGVVTYIEFADAFADMLDDALVSQDDSGNYTVTQRGAAVLDGLSDRLYAPIKEKALRSALRLLAFKTSGSRTSASVEPAGDGFDVVCSIQNANQVMFSCHIHVRDAEYAQRLRDNFDARPEDIYKGVLALLSGDVNYMFE